MTNAPSKMPRLSPGATSYADQRLIERDQQYEAEVH